MQNLYKDLIKELSKNEKFLLEGQVSASLVRDKAYKLDPELVGLLFGSDRLKHEFFTETNGAMIFNYPKFAKFITNKEFLPDSYTEFESNIGLSVGDKFLSENKDVVLSFPFKDCILEGGMDTEEAKGRKEIFYNQTLAPDDVHKLKSPKALKSWEKYDAKGKQEVKELRLKDNGTFDENFIIKGNNLLALYSLLPRYKGKVKLIYIDPPYNTGGDDNIFTYNNTFNHSTWLTFMKNRLDLAKQFLSEDGFITIAIDHFELFYLGLLADEIFGRENRLGIITVLHNPKGRNQAKFFSENSEFLLVYAKNIHEAQFNRVAIDDTVLASFDKEDSLGSFRYEKYLRARTEWSKKNKPNNWYPIYVSKDLHTITSVWQSDYYELYPITNSGEFSWKNIKETFDDLNIDGYFKAEKEGDKIVLYHKYYEQQVFKNVWTDKKYQSEFNGTNLLKRLIGENKFSYPKSLYAVIDAIKIMSKPGDIVMDFFGGSGTSFHAVLELNETEKNNHQRRGILIEQLDEHTDIILRRLNSGILKKDETFIYFDLAKNNITYLEKIESLENGVQAWSLFEDLASSIWISYRVDIDKFKEHKDQFLALEIEEQKKVLKDIINYNHLYVNYEDMEDEAYKDSGLSEEDKTLTTQFYEKKPTDNNEIL
jgi:adenine-specific DNA-methyltransferase